MNNVILMGRLTRDPEINMTQAGTEVARFSLAVDKQLSKEKKQEMESRNQPTADFINCVSFGKQAEFIKSYLAKGCRALVQGRIHTGSYEAQDGTRRYTTDIMVQNIEPIDWANSNDGGGFNDDFSQPFADETDGRIPF